MSLKRPVLLVPAWTASGASELGAVQTRVDRLERFYPAESDHQDYLPNHLDEAYVILYDLPKLERLKRLFPVLYRQP